MPAHPTLQPARRTILAIFLCTTASHAAQDDDLQFFESRIRPVLSRHCYECHSDSAGASESGLQVDSRAGIRRGGERGPAVVPGKPDKSWLLKAISHSDADLQMPPRVDRLPDHVIADFIKWIRSGAADPRDKPDATHRVIRVRAEDHWAYQPLSSPTIPQSGRWARSPLDHFVLRRLTDKGLVPRCDAQPAHLIRRLSFDLIGLPPTQAEVNSFVELSAQRGLDHAVESSADRLLTSEAFGERWGRHWLDVARYAESSGKEANITFPYAWRYRDYVIDAFNADVPFDRFLTEQLAGDLLPFEGDAERTRLLIATGFLAIGPKNLDAMDPRQFAADIVDEQIDAVSRVFLASSLACARCHDHKFDPFSMQDYYALAGVFTSSRTFFGTAISPSNRNGGDPLVLPRLASTAVLHRSISGRRVEQLKAERAALQRERFEKGEAFTLRDALRVLWRTGAIDGQLEKVDSAGRALPLAMGMLDADKPSDARMLARGEVSSPGDPVPRAFPKAIRSEQTPQIPATQSGRLELARWLTSDEHPLTSRVAVNRVWSHLFGHGLVRTPDDFGSTGQKPTHPELLDYLATRFTREGWSIKRLIRTIVASRTYQQASDFDATAFRTDPENTLLWRMPKRRLEAEAMRDAMLSVSGELDRKRPVGSLVGRVIGDRPVSLVGLDKRLPRDLDDALHRSVYLPVMRDRLPDVLDVFDFAEPSLVTGKRETTNVPTQALYLMNSDFVRERATALAQRLRAESNDDRALIRAAFLRCFAREPEQTELSRMLAYLKTTSEDGNDKAARTANLCHALLMTVEFRMLD